jgi:tetratricopeptide (TPR) repeat protein
MNSLGVAYANCGRCEDSVNILKKAIVGNRFFSSPYLNLGTTYEIEKEFDKAEAVYKSLLGATKNIPDLAVANIRLGDLKSKMGDKNSADFYYMSALQLCGNRFEEIVKVVNDRLRGIMPREANPAEK